MSAMTETPARPTIEPTDRQAGDLRDEPIQTGGATIRVDRPSVDRTPATTGSVDTDPGGGSPSDAELWFG